MRSDRRGTRPIAAFAVPHTAGPVSVQAFVAQHGDLPVYLLDAEPIVRSGSVYSSEASLDAEKYTFFSMAALELARHLAWSVDVVHANDWHTALACYAVLLRRRQTEPSAVVATVLTVHNLPFMGPDVDTLLDGYGLPRVQTGLPGWAGSLPLPLGLWAADAIVAVSPSYAREIQTAEFGSGLQDYLRARRDSLHGILNGIDTEDFNPALDPALAANFGIPTLDRRVQNKAALQVRLGLPVEPDVPLFGMVSRLDPQKGTDLLAAALRRLRDLEWQAVILGTGMSRLERSLKRLETEFPNRFRAELRYDAGLARQIYGGADAFLMPSRYEPCGLAQMIAMRYGCLPIVSAVGGLKDTVVADQDGFVIGAPTAARLVTAMTHAMRLLPDRAVWRRMQKAAMARDFSWSASARRYFEVYQQAAANAVSSPAS
jgi:starch synthase